MYLWRKLSDKQRGELLAFRKFNQRPWHSPLHRVGESGRYLLTAACYQHHVIVGKNPERMAEFSEALLATLEPHCADINACCPITTMPSFARNGSPICLRSRPIARTHLV
jgi:hypothetical protein